MDIEMCAQYVDFLRSRSQDKHSHPCCDVWAENKFIRKGSHNPPRFAWKQSGSAVTSESSSVTTGAAESVPEPSKKYVCPRGHSFSTNSPIVVAVDNDPDYNTGPICGYCYVDWFKVNLNADEVTDS